LSRHIVTRETPHPQPALGKAIRELRERQELSLRAFAPKADVTFNTLSLIERGEANPTWETVKRIAAGLGVSVSALAKAAERLEWS
jgi:XRE family transcriptional regulator, regulator of sulfur utilization